MIALAYITILCGSAGAVTGDASSCAILGRSVLMPVLTGIGSIIPAVMCIREHAPDVVGGPPLFLAVLKPVLYREDVLLCEIDVRAAVYSAIAWVAF